MKRYVQSILEIIEKKKLICNFSHLQINFSLEKDRKRKRHKMTMSGDNFGKFSQADWDRQSMNLQNVFGDTVTYLRSSHRGPIIPNADDVLPPVNDEDEIDGFMRSEIHKYNKMKRQKQVGF